MVRTSVCASGPVSRNGRMALPEAPSAVLALENAQPRDRSARRSRTALMHKFWSWLGLNLGKHWIVVLTTRRGADRGTRLRHHEARVLHWAGQLPEQERSGLQGQRRVPAPVRRPGDAHARDHGQGSHGQRAVHAGGCSPVPGRREAAAWKRAHRQRRQPVDRARVRRRAGAQPVGRPDPERRGQGRVGCGGAGEDPGRPGGPQRGRGTDADAAQRHPAGTASARQSRRTPTS